MALAQAGGIDSAKARQYFGEVRKACQGDAGRLWNKSLCGPMLFADPATNSVVANQADAEGRLQPQDGVFIGKLPPKMNPANTNLQWAGVHWTMVMWPLPENPVTRTRLMMHELYHRIQSDLGLPPTSPANAHLATLEGRIWLRLEWRALKQALARPEAPPAERRRAVEDALLFRMRRRALFPGAAEQERQLEMHEGLAEYTGYKLRGTVDAATAEAVISRLKSSESDAAFSRSFAYVSGPAYGLLLDFSGKPWRGRLTRHSDLGDLLRAAYSVVIPAGVTASAEKRMAVYDGVALRWSETRQDEQRKAVLAAYTRRLVTGPVLHLPAAGQFNFSFDPNNVIPLDDTSSIYVNLRVTDEWGILEVTDGALMKREQGKFSGVVVEAPRDFAGKREITGNGWNLTLAEGWRLAGGERPGDLKLVKTE